MRPFANVAIGVAAVAGMALLLLFGARAGCQHRALYKGGITFVGQAAGPFTSSYHRMFMWRDANDTSPLPVWSVHLDGQVMRFDELTPERVTALGGALSTGVFHDRGGNMVQYRFENGRLTWVSLDTPHPSTTPSPSAPYQRIALSCGDGPPFTLPISRGALIRACGEPEDSYLHFAQ